jgi:hypothetical protein
MSQTYRYSFRRGACIVLASGGLVGVLAACGSSSGSSSSGSQPSQPASAPATSTPVAATSTPAASAPAHSGAAAPGTKLAVGSSATVKYKPLSGSGGGPATLKVNVQSVQKGTLDDFKGIQLDATQKAATPIYVKVKVTNLGPGTVDVDGTSAAIEGIDNTGNTAQSVTFIGDFPRCPDHQSTTQMKAGSSYANCLTFLVPGGITKVAYTGTDDYINSPVTWATS